VQATLAPPQRAPDGIPVDCERRRPEQAMLHRLVQQPAAIFFAQAEDAAGADLPQDAQDGFDASLECGILAHGFLLDSGDCGDCGHDKLGAFSLVTPVLTASACTPPCAAAPTTARRWNNCAAASPARLAGGCSG